MPLTPDQLLAMREIPTLADVPALLDALEQAQARLASLERVAEVAIALVLPGQEPPEGLSGSDIKAWCALVEALEAAGMIRDTARSARAALADLDRGPT